MGRLLTLLFFGLVAASESAWGASLTVTMRQVNSGGVGEIVGLMVFQDSAKGLRITPNLRGLTPGQAYFRFIQQGSGGLGIKGQWRLQVGAAAK